MGYRREPPWKRRLYFGYYVCGTKQMPSECHVGKPAYLSNLGTSTALSI
jgi:hypothetical protein